jgi:glycosyltransferase involved in cell wall biosynthesis
MINTIQVDGAQQSVPRVSVVMGVRNGERFIRRAIESILGQTLADFEFIIIDDASTDRTGDISRAYASRDSRIRLLSNEVNLGLAASLNRGIRESSGVYIARMDADDSSRPERIMLQADFLDMNPDIGICGGYICYHKGGRSSIKRFYTDHDWLAAQLLFKPCFLHSAVMFRRERALNLGLLYNEDYSTTQDYELWTRMIGPMRGANIPFVLLDYYCHDEQATKSKYDKMIMYCRLIHSAQLRAYVNEFSESELKIHDRISIPHDPFAADELDEAQAWLMRLLQRNSDVRRFDHSAIARVCFDMWRGVCYETAAHGRLKFWQYWQSPLSRSLRFSWSSVKLLLLCLVTRQKYH